MYLEKGPDTRFATNGLVLVIVGLWCFTGMVGVSEAEEFDIGQLIGNDKIVAGGTYEPPRLMRAEGWEWEHEVRVWLPPTYHAFDKTYPTLWVTDNALEIALGGVVGSESGLAPEVILFLWEERLLKWDSKSWSRYMERALEYMKERSK